MLMGLGWTILQLSLLVAGTGSLYTNMTSPQSMIGAWNNFLGAPGANANYIYIDDTIRQATAKNTIKDRACWNMFIYR